MPGQRRVPRLDFFSFEPAQAERDHQGLRIRRAVFGRSGVLTYQTADGRTVREWRRPQDMRSPEVLDTYRLLPVTNGHPVEGGVDLDNAPYLEVGSTGDDVRAEDHEGGVLARGDIAIRRRSAIQAIEAGRRQLSHGYWAVLIDESGVTPDGEPYDVIQIPVAGDHMALVDLGRAGPMTEFSLDAAPSGKRWRLTSDGARMVIDDATVDTLEQKPDVCSVNGTNPSGGKIMPTKLRIDGVLVEVADEDAQLVERLVSERDNAVERADGLKVKLDESEGKVGTLEGERDGLKAKLDESESKLDRFEQDAKSRELEQLRQQVKPWFGEQKIDSLDAGQLKRAVVVAAFTTDGKPRFTDEVLKAKPEAYVQALFDQAMETVPATGSSSSVETVNTATRPGPLSGRGRRDGQPSAWAKLHNRNASHRS